VGGHCWVGGGVGVGASAEDDRIVGWRSGDGELWTKGMEVVEAWIGEMWGVEL
jgi:hypothetical protein